MVLDDTHVHARDVAQRQTLERRDGLAGDEDLVTVLREVVEVDAKVLEEAEFDTHVHLVRELPLQLLVAEEAFGNRTGDTAGAAIVAAHGDVVLIEEAVAAHGVVTDHAVGGAELQPGDHGVVLQEGLVGGDPAHGDRREETEAVGRGELLRSVVTHVQLEEVAVVIGVGQTGRRTDDVVGDGGAAGFPVTAVGVHHRAHGVLLGERAGVVDTGLRVDRVAGAAVVAEAQRLRVLAAVGVGQRVVDVVDLRGVQAHGPRSVEDTAVIRVVGYLAVDGEALRHEAAEVVVDRQRRVQVLVRIGLESAVVHTFVSGTVHPVVGDDLAVVDAELADRRRADGDRGDTRGLVDEVTHHPVLVPAVHRTGDRHVDVFRVGSQVQGDRHVLGEVEVQVRTEAEAVHPRLRVVTEFLHRVVLHVTALVDVTDVQEVVHPVGTAADVRVETGLGSELLEHHTIVVVVAVEILAHLLDLLVVLLVAGQAEQRVLELRDQIVAELRIVAVVHEGLVAQLHVLPGVGALGLDHERGHGLVERQGEARLALLAAAGLDQDDTVRTADTVEGGRGGVLQDGEALDLVHVHRTHSVRSTLHTIHDDQRALAVGGGGTTQVHGRTITSRLTTTALHGGKTRDTTGERVVQTSGRRLAEFLRSHRGDSGGNRRLLLGTEGHHDGVFEKLIVSSQSDGEVRTRARLDALGRKTDAGDNEHCVFRDIAQDESTLVGRFRSIRGAFN